MEKAVEGGEWREQEQTRTSYFLFRSEVLEGSFRSRLLSFKTDSEGEKKH